MPASSSLATGVVAEWGVTITDLVPTDSRMCNERNTPAMVLLSFLLFPTGKLQLGREHYVACGGSRLSGGGLRVRGRVCSSVGWVRLPSIWAGPQSHLGKLFCFI